MATKKKVIQGGLDVQKSDGTSALTVDESTGAITVSNVSGSNLIGNNYSPGTTNVLNVTSSSVSSAFYQRVGLVVTVFVKGSVTPTAANTITIFRVGIPVAANFTSQDNVCGSATLNVGTSDDRPMTVLANVTGDDAEFYVYPITTGAQEFRGSFSYKII